ncbi:unnamed protein product [Chrysodeixis includens]|uniref:Phenoloxidase-activating factor 2 n=1 Tax=Chrysodeixis includens TaxID=689277 RepID=A0A9P0BQ18_CHRIL|nr:unnamed protein product [Chrysodeixis includens]
MRWSTVTFLLLPIIFAYATADWSWGADGDSKPSEQVDQKDTSLLQGEQIPETQERRFESNSTVLDDIVDELVSGKQGRSLGGFDDVYSEPTIKDALEAGDNAEARNLIKGRLCTLGLIQCEDEDVQEKRTYLSPDDVIYAQPVDIKPIGKPIASIPIRGPPRAYGPPQPMPYPPRPQKYPPKRVGYGGNSRPGFSDKYGVAGGNYQFSQSSGIYNAHETNYVTKAPSYASQGPYAYENTKPNFNKGSSQSGTKADTVVQQHVHHHYVHGDADKEPKVIIKPVAIPVGSVAHLNSQNNVQQSSDIITASGADFGSFSSGGFKPMSGGFSLDSSKPIYEADTVYGSQYGHNAINGGSHILNQGLPNQFSNNAFEDQRYGNSLGNYASHNNEFHKKELHVGGSVNNLYSQGPATFGQNNGFGESYHEAKAQGFDCVCVNYDQCPSQEVIGRRDDLYLPIDPRNKGKDVVALTDEQLDSLNKTDATASTSEASSNSTTSEGKKISKREADEDTAAEATKEIEPRFPRLPLFGGHHGIDYKHVQPTFGVSFALPPAPNMASNFHPYNPQLSPFGRSIFAGGINLGIATVNPLLSLQISKDEYGEKVYSPLVHFHITPSQHKIAALNQIFDDKKYYLLNKHLHYHTLHHPLHVSPALHPGYPVPVPPPPYYHGPHVPPPHFGPSHHSLHSPRPLPHIPSPPHPPHHYQHHASPVHYPPHYEPSVYSPQYPNYEKENIRGPPRGFNDYNEDASEDIGSEDYPYDEQRSLNSNIASANVSNNADSGTYANRFAYSRSFDLPLKSPEANRGYQTIRFPDNRKKREIDVENIPLSVQERQGYFGRPPVQQCRQNQVCCRRPLQPQAANKGQCGIRHSQGINGRVKTPAYVDGESEFGEYPWQTAILKKDPKESVYVCGGTLIDGLHIMTAAHCVKSYKGFELRVRLGEWDVNRDVEFYPYVERDIVSVHVHPLFYAGTLDNDLAILKMDHPVEWTKYPHISPACLPDKYSDYSGQRCWTTGWGKDAFDHHGKYQNILKEVDVPIIGHGQCQQQLRRTRLGYNYELKPGFLCAGGEEGKDACKGDGGGPLVCERSGTWQVVGVVSWGIGCGEPGVPGVYVKVAQYLDWISQVTGKFSNY